MDQHGGHADWCIRWEDVACISCGGCILAVLARVEYDWLVWVDALEAGADAVAVAEGFHKTCGEER